MRDASEATGLTAWRLTLPGEAQTEGLGERLAQAAQPGDVLLLSGDLGAGKTTLARGLARGLGITDPVTSPTFGLHHAYRGRLPFEHLDLYRLTPAEVEAAGLHELWEAGRSLCAVEWPERLVDSSLNLSPPDALHLALAATADDGRVAVFNASPGTRAAAWLASVAAASEDLNP